MRPLVLALVFLLLAHAGSRAASPSALCRSAIASAERGLGVPDRFMQAIGIVESGRPDERGSVSAWPWTINVEGVGHVFDSKEAAIKAVQNYQASGIRSIDVGCMQVNLSYHGDAFGSLEQAFDPAANAHYAARFLLDLLAKTGSWPRAAAAYHSMTPDIGADYARKVLAVWARPGLGDGPMLASYRRGPLEEERMVPSTASLMRPPPQTVATAPSSPHLGPASPSPSSGGIAFASSMTARILPMAGHAGSTLTGRSLDSYRANPTRLAVLPLPRG